MTDPNEPDIRTASIYLVLERSKWRYDPPRVVSMRKEKPRLESGQVAVKVQLRIPMDLFNTYIPVVEAELAEGDFILPELEVGFENS
jgi:hypothetical protein